MKVSSLLYSKFYSPLLLYFEAMRSDLFRQKTTQLSRQVLFRNKNYHLHNSSLFFEYQLYKAINLHAAIIFISPFVDVLCAEKDVKRAICEATSSRQAGREQIRRKRYSSLIFFRFD